MSHLQLVLHHGEHGADFDAATPADYQQLADEFWANPRPVHVFECARSKGDTLRFDTMTDAFSVLGSNMVIRTFYKPVPCSSLPASLAIPMRMSGDCHGESSNLAYFQRECRK